MLRICLLSLASGLLGREGEAGRVSRPDLLRALAHARAAAFQVAPSARAPASRGRRSAVRATAAEAFGEVVASDAGLLMIRPEDRGLAKAGTLLDIGGLPGVLVAERCGRYFAALEPPSAAPPEGTRVALRAANLTTAAPGPGPWAGVFDYLGRGDAAASTGPVVFGEPVPQSGRKTIGAPLHSGVLAIDALTPIGRGQSMLLFGPDHLPAGSGRSDLAVRMLAAAARDGVRSVLVLTEPAEAREATLQALEAQGARPRVLQADSAVQGLLAAYAACSLAESQGEDVLVVVDSLRPHLVLWRAMAAMLAAEGVPVTPEEEGSQQRAFYARLVERAARRKDGGSLTLLLLQPSVSVLPAEAERKEVYDVADFEAATETVQRRVAAIAQRVALTPEVLVQVGIPLPGSDHPAAGTGQPAQQHLEELTSLADGHIDLRENLAQQGRVPPVDPSNSLTRIGVGSTKLRPQSQSPAMAEVSRALRLELAAASDPAAKYFDRKEQRRAAAYAAVLQQPDTRPLELGEEVARLRAATLGLLDAPAERGDVGDLLARVVARVRAAEPELLARVSSSGLLGGDADARLQELLTAAVAEETGERS